MARPEASTAEGYLKDECIGFVTEYLHRFDAVNRRVWEVLQGAGKEYIMPPAIRDLAHQYVVTNISVMEDFHK
jgi:hypothetical protein